MRKTMDYKTSQMLTQRSRRVISKLSEKLTSERTSFPKNQNLEYLFAIKILLICSTTAKTL